jgi:hypothetical protein
LSKLAYVLLCVVVPPVWGLLSYWLFDLIFSRRKAPAAAGPAAPPADDKCDRE